MIPTSTNLAGSLLQSCAWCQARYFRKRTSAFLGQLPQRASKYLTMISLSTPTQWVHFSPAPPVCCDASLCVKGLRATRDQQTSRPISCAQAPRVLSFFFPEFSSNSLLPDPDFHPSVPSPRSRPSIGRKEVLYPLREPKQPKRQDLASLHTTGARHQQRRYFYAGTRWKKQVRSAAVRRGEPANTV